MFRRVREFRKTGFRDGLLAGLSSPYATGFGGRFRPKTRARDLVTESWGRVGRATWDAIGSEQRTGDEVGRAGRRED
jgi:hypothetical protein